MLDLFPNSLRDLVETAVRRYIVRLKRFIIIMILGLVGIVFVTYGTEYLVSLGLGETVAGYLTRGIVIGAVVLGAVMMIWQAER
ncbi:hypothetical protein [Haloarcula salinisoli]|uniref:Uncharacterized protein n=1 Tax=Haloarcula salinisoli TaxID=2487746 RepID=A0A8J7YFD0_9EURY|nr:hypothetical protein [Halomicroarcula salinisoli]MBX0286198.1 hypothetical protein [Halomicroarcula salinisoli]MBX0302313.1 hypothetical protein [Halomicroarcula salinisoli]